jgi:hypothetical protein
LPVKPAEIYRQQKNPSGKLLVKKRRIPALLLLRHRIRQNCFRLRVKKVFAPGKRKNKAGQEQASRLGKPLCKVLTEKLQHKGIILHSLSDFLPKLAGSLKQYWERDLALQINKLPSLTDVVEELPSFLDQFMAPYYPIR